MQLSRGSQPERAQTAYSGSVKRPPMTVVETRRFLDDTRGILFDDERSELVAFIATYPERGDVVPDAVGVRKLRWR